MRESIAQQLVLVSSPLDHVHARELFEMGRVLDELEEAAEWVTLDLCRGGVRRDWGRFGMSGEQVLRAYVLKKMTGLSYAQLSFHLADSMTYRGFCRLRPGAPAPSSSTLQHNIGSVRAETIERIGFCLIKLAEREWIEDGRWTRMDTTVVETDIHHPTDSSLLNDCVRALTLVLEQCRELCAVKFSDHRRRAKRRALEIANAKSMKHRRPLYEDLLRVAGWTVGYAKDAVVALGRTGCSDDAVHRGKLVGQVRRLIELCEQVADQAHRRVILGESVRADEKVVSIFEPHTDIIIKDNRDTYYGHKVALVTGKSGLVLDVRVLEGNPNDSMLTVPLLQRQCELYGRAPEANAADGAFGSTENLVALKQMGVQEVCFTAGRLPRDEMTSSLAMFRKLRNFRAALEGTISFLKRCFGMARSLVSGFGSFCADVFGSVLSHNLLLVARHRLR
jgi:IS5 family transposase